MSATILCPYCKASQEISAQRDFRPFYVNCSQCASEFIAEPVKNGMVVYRRDEAPCCSDPECRELETAGSGQD